MYRYISVRRVDGYIFIGKPKSDQLIFLRILAAVVSIDTAYNKRCSATQAGVQMFSLTVQSDMLHLDNCHQGLRVI